MNRMKGVSSILLVMFGLQVVAASAAEGNRFWRLQNRLRVEYDDNVRQEATGEDSSIKIIEEIEFHSNFNFENTFIGLSYTPAFVWWDDRDEDDSDIHHYFTVNANHRFSPRVSASLKETFLRAEQPELVERGSILRKENDYNQNDLNGDVNVNLSPSVRVTASGRYLLLSYDDDTVAAANDYDLYVAGLTLSRQLKPETQVRGELRYEMIEYDQAVDRGSDTVSVGVGADQTFSPSLLGQIRGGVSVKDFDSALAGDETAPYADASLTFLPFTGHTDYNRCGILTL